MVHRFPQIPFTSAFESPSFWLAVETILKEFPLEYLSHVDQLERLKCLEVYTFLEQTSQLLTDSEVQKPSLWLPEETHTETKFFLQSSSQDQTEVEFLEEITYFVAFYISATCFLTHSLITFSLEHFPIHPLLRESFWENQT